MISCKDAFSTSNETGTFIGSSFGWLGQTRCRVGVIRWIESQCSGMTGTERSECLKSMRRGRKRGDVVIWQLEQVIGPSFALRCALKGRT